MKPHQVMDYAHWYLDMVERTGSLEPSLDEGSAEGWRAEHQRYVAEFAELYQETLTEWMLRKSRSIRDSGMMTAKPAAFSFEEDSA